MRIAIVAVELQDGNEYKAGWDLGRVHVPTPTDLASIDENLSGVLPYSTFARAVTLANIDPFDPRADMVRDGFTGEGTLGRAAWLAEQTFKRNDDDAATDATPADDGESTDVTATLDKVATALDSIMARLDKIEKGE